MVPERCSEGKMMTALFRKIKSNSGESIAETLIALLVAALGLIILASAINSTSNIITTSNNKIKEYNEKEKIVVQQKVESGTVTGKISFNNEKVSYDSGSIDININIFINNVINEKDVISFSKKAGAGS